MQQEDLWPTSNKMENAADHSICLRMWSLAMASLQGNVEGCWPTIEKSYSTGYGNYTDACTLTKFNYDCPGVEDRQAWINLDNPLIHDSLTTDPYCTNTGKGARNLDHTGMSFHVKPSQELAVGQTASFKIYVGARTNRLEAEKAIRRLPDVKVWATAWAGSAEDDGNPGTFFYAFDVPAGVWYVSGACT